MQARRPMRRQATLPPSLTGEDFRSLPSTSPCGRLRKRHRRRSVRGAPRRHLATRLFVEPEVFEAEAVVNAVDHHSHPLHLRVAARRLSGIEDNRTGAVLGQPPFDFPYQMLAFVLLGFGRLLIDQLVDFRTAIACVVALCGTDIVLVELLVGVVDGALADIEADSKIFAHDPRIPLRRVNGFKLAVDIDFLQLVDQDYRRIAVARDVACRHRDREPFVGAVTELLQNLTGFGAVLGDIGIIAGQRLEQLRGMLQTPSGAGSTVPPISPCPSVMMSIKALRSKVKDIARRRSALSKGGLSRLMIRVRLTFVGATSQIACGAWLFISLRIGIVML